MNVNDYLIDQSSLNWNSLLEEWHWLLPPQFTVWLLTKTGDLFIAVPDGSILMLDVGAGTLEIVAESRDEFCEKADQPEIADDWLMISIVDRLVASGKILRDHECYSFSKLPILGGSYDVENRVPLPIHEHFGCWGSVHKQLVDVPDGTKVVIKPINVPEKK